MSYRSQAYALSQRWRSRGLIPKDALPADALQALHEMLTEELRGVASDTLREVLALASEARTKDEVVGVLREYQRGIRNG